jgi:hypothetical protein
VRALVRTDDLGELAQLARERGPSEALLVERRLQPLEHEREVQDLLILLS